MPTWAGTSDPAPLSRSRPSVRAPARSSLCFPRDPPATAPLSFITACLPDGSALPAVFRRPGRWVPRPLALTLCPPAVCPQAPPTVCPCSPPTVATSRTCSPLWSSPSSSNPTALRGHRQTAAARGCPQWARWRRASPSPARGRAPTRNQRTTASPRQTPHQTPSLALRWRSILTI